MNITEIPGINTVGETPKGSDLLNQFNIWLGQAEMSLSETEWRKEAEEDYEFYSGKQDSTEVLAALAAQRRPNSVYNEVKPKIDKLIGLADQIRQSPTALPVGKEDEPLSELINGAFKHFRYTEGLEDKEMDCFEHSTKSGRSFLYYYIDRSNPFEPLIKPCRLPGRDVLLDPNSIEYDLSDARFVFISRWYKEEDIIAHWPQFKGDIVKMMQGSTDVYTPSYFDEAKELYRLIEVYYKIPEKRVWFINPLTGKPDNLSRLEWRKFKKNIEDGMELPDGSTIDEVPEAVEAVKKVVKYGIFSGNILLENGASPYQYEGFPLVLYGAYKDEDENRWFGAINMMKDPQRALNTMRRQLSHLLQTAPKGILMYEAGAILNIDEYDEHSAEPNFRMEMARDKLNAAKFTDQPQISPIYNLLDATYTQSIKDVSGIQDPMMGKQIGTREPGVTARLRMESNLAVLFILFRNFRASRIQGGKVFLSLMQQYIKRPMMIRLEGPNGVTLEEINSQMNPESEGFNDISAGRFDLRIDESAENTTMRREIAQMLMEYAHNNPDSVPPEVILEYIDIPLSAKTKVMEYNQARIDREYAIQMAEIEAKTKTKEAK